ncbi:50S ribosomal protein L6 [Hydrocarboniclastica marina]|uniref:Large ribosomal subunit protein uL6 n=1 Tax=Hydrocarboniclastica marina TaxID=2259620 RepID=A0A4P7XGS5_9ALTE|nr:50S ribosomal protein L6 [Hydrocarboniclastica marina]MAL99629.1 50S ribosomal protein L6 [Alteromonadaceae bacterium]QCF24967.1 50S ribosomal protein L6 [Hydrocarboniclastica marina]|tara:strand:- start:1906 stop:2439 length:534 start_codon:yes stop_codon:yes gene_type:complete
MSRVANNPVVLPSGVEISLSGQDIQIKGSKGSLNHTAHSSVEVKQEDGRVLFAARDGAKQSRALAGTTRALVNNMVTGVHTGFERKLQLVGVGYRAQAQGKKLNLTLGFSHPVEYDLPEGITAETPTQTEVVIRGIDKQQVGQVAAEIRAFRPPEPYKGKGVRYADEMVRRKEAKKK